MTTEIITGPDPIQVAISAMQGVRKAFGPPGDHGYGTREGDALFALYNAMAGLMNLADKPALTPQSMLAAYDASMGVGEMTDIQRRIADIVTTAVPYASTAFQMGMDEYQGAHAMARSFLLALIDPLHPDLDYLRADPAAGAAARAQQAGEVRNG